MTKEQIELILQYVDNTAKAAYARPYGWDAFEKRSDELREQLFRTVKVQEST